ncbi:flavonol 3-O-glucosyltransferase UGT76E12-like [Cannabis sativa]|uniref:flavonol 3-O-glucosyltransferase UGT76E12-like n=1 Tax=Cannabis sativa TaxID=3483 RepID=UPI0029CA1FD2|nr:flavonol 3-O-glucosyltransferase UGT76E12-like [Cannabis sativa]
MEAAEKMAGIFMPKWQLAHVLARNSCFSSGRVLQVEDCFNLHRHIERNIDESGLTLLHGDAKTVSGAFFCLCDLCLILKISEFLNEFYKKYLFSILELIFGVLRDSLYKPGFNLHVMGEGGLLTRAEPLWQHVALSLFPKFLPIGPLIANRANRLLDISQSQFWANDSSCISWLNQQKDCSVIYIAFGSFTIHEQHQFYELAHGLKLTRRPFLWVVRPGFISSEKAKSTMFDPLHTFLGIENMVGKIVSWAP